MGIKAHWFFEEGPFDRPTYVKQSSATSAAIDAILKSSIVVPHPEGSLRPTQLNNSDASYEENW